MRADTERLSLLTRRHFLQQGQLGLGAIALSSLLGGQATASPSVETINPLAPRVAHFPAKAKQVIYLHMTGSPPNLDMWDYKPELVKRDGEDCPDSFLAGRTFAFTTGVPKLLGTPRKFERYGQGGQWMSDALPHLHDVADDLCMVHSMYTEQFNHAPAELLLYTGSPRSGRTSAGTVCCSAPRSPSTRSGIRARGGCSPSTTPTWCWRPTAPSGRSSSSLVRSRTCAAAGPPTTRSC